LCLSCPRLGISLHPFLRRTISTLLKSPTARWGSLLIIWLQGPSSAKKLGDFFPFWLSLLARFQKNYRWYTPELPNGSKRKTVSFASGFMRKNISSSNFGLS
jgi:hypothetical protein